MREKEHRFASSLLNYTLPVCLPPYLRARHRASLKPNCRYTMPLFCNYSRFSSLLAASIFYLFLSSLLSLSPPPPASPASTTPYKPIVSLSLLPSDVQPRHVSVDYTRAGCHKSSSSVCGFFCCWNLTGTTTNIFSHNIVKHILGLSLISTLVSRDHLRGLSLTSQSLVLVSLCHVIGTL